MVNRTVNKQLALHSMRHPSNLAACARYSNRISTGDLGRCQHSGSWNGFHIARRSNFPPCNNVESGDTNDWRAPCRRQRRVTIVIATLIATVLLAYSTTVHAADRFEGQFYCGEGDVEYLELLDIARRMFAPDAEFQNVAMLYTPAWNGFVEGPTWGAWWIQNSYGPTYCALPFYDEPYITFLQNAQDLWFDQMGNGQRRVRNDWIPPDGCLCDAASPNWFMPKQGDGRVDIHDWGMEFTAAGLLMQSELLLINRDRRAIEHYLPKLRRCAAFIESRRDPKNNLFLAGPAANLLAPSYAGFKTDGGTYEKAYLTGLSITYIAALDRLIELETLAGNTDNAKRFQHHRGLARQGLALLTTAEDYFIKSLDPDGTRHGVFGADKHGYFEAVANHDAICFRVADDAQAKQIYRKIVSIPGLRPHHFIITNYPSLDDMYVPDKGWLWQFGTWVNGGHWSTCEARMMMAYYRLGQYEDARRSMKELLNFARQFRMDNPLVAFGSAVYQPRQPINLCYDSFGPPAALVRGLFEYLYKADTLKLLPHIPPGISRLEQHFPIRFGDKRLYLATVGSGPITSVTVDDQPWQRFDQQSVTLTYDKLPQRAVIQIALGGAKPTLFAPKAPDTTLPTTPPSDQWALDSGRYPVISPNELPLRIGADPRGTNQFLGQIARVQVFDRALAAAEIASLAACKSAEPVEVTGLLADWTFENHQGNVFPNTVAKRFPAKIVGNVELVDTPLGRAIRLTGKGFLEIAHDSALNLENGGTISAWICPQKLPHGGGRIIDKCGYGTANGYNLDTFPGNSLRLITERGTPQFDAKLTPGTWVHVAGTADADGKLVLYVDGEPVSTQKGRLPMPVTSLRQRVDRLTRFYRRMVHADLGSSYEARHAKLAGEYLAICHRRMNLLAQGQLELLPARSQLAADKSYFDTTAKLCDGLETLLQSYRHSDAPHQAKVFRIWNLEHQRP